ncbi:RBBP9/YdeN family alpha/beta hydrolase [Pseudahrensia aquimaris]|uniref:RBBP9/YdeN family alpha/beta hydrolase n=1 Tax=Pseudahrensia aquimaris TaxID=744461 RepID=A0ABW3FK92_9HYPH
MKIADADILTIPGYTNSTPDHWLSRWERQFKTASRVEQADWHKPVLEDWTANVIAAVERAERPVIAIGHSLGVQTLVQAVSQMSEQQASRIKGAYLTAPPDVENAAIRPKHLMTFGPYPREPLPFPSVVVASQNDPWCAQPVAQDMAASWGSLFIDAGENGHLNTESGHGPWPEGLLVFAEFMKKLK